MQKRIDIFLALFSIAVGISMSLLPKTLPVIITCILLIYGLLVYPVWNFWYIERSCWLRFAALFFLASCLCLFGYYIGTSTQEQLITKQPTVEETAKEKSVKKNLQGNSKIKTTEKPQENSQAIAVPQRKETTPNPILASVRIANQKQIPSTNAQLPYGLEVILQTDTIIEPVAFVVVFTGEVGDGRAGFTSGGAYMQTKFGTVAQQRNIYFFEWLSPAFTPSNPIRITVFSKSYIKAVEFQKMDYIWP